MAKILIIGCGAIGSELARILSVKGHEVTGLKRNPPTSTAGHIKYFTADITSPADLAGLNTDFEQVFFIVSPDSRNEQSYHAVYETGLNNLLAKLPQAHWIMVSSTSVYGQSKGEWVDEDSIAQADNTTSHIIRLAEQRLMDSNPDNIVVRFSGIYGPGREYLLRMARQTPAIQRDPPYFTNRIHQRDCVGVLSFLLEQRLAGVPLKQCYLASDDDPAPMWEVMNWLTERLHCQLPTARDGGSVAIGREPMRPTAKTVGTGAVMNKRCNNLRIKMLGYAFQYPSYKEGYLELISNDFFTN